MRARFGFERADQAVDQGGVDIRHVRQENQRAGYVRRHGGEARR